MSSDAIWVAMLYVSQKTAQKLASKHGLDVDDVRQAVTCVPGLRAVWDEHPERGLRAIIEAYIAGRKLLVVLYPANDQWGDGWHLGSAYYI